MPLLSLVWGILALIGMVIAFFPCLGALNWLVIPFAAVGLVISLIAMSKSPAQSRGQAMGGTICSGIALILGFIRLILGGGVL